jgi:hypothetical protein
MAKKDGITGWVVLTCFAYFLGSGYASLKLTLFLLPTDAEMGPDGMQFVVKFTVFTFLMLIFTIVGLQINKALMIRRIPPPRKD